MGQNLESQNFEKSGKRIIDEEYDFIENLGFDSAGMKRKIFDEKHRKEKKLCYLNEYFVYEVEPIDDHPCYQVIDELGTGAYGQVLKVKIKSGRYKNDIFALKRCKLGVKREDNEKMLREVIANMRLFFYGMIKCWHHWIEYDEQDNGKLILNLLMDLADETLRNWMKSNNKRDYETVFEMIMDICESIGFIHSRGIIHRDLKPENILIKNDECKLGDFGASALSRIKFESNEEYFKTWTGTFSYMAPEVIANKEYTNKVDIFSLGLIWMELMVEFDDEQQSLKAHKDLKEHSLLPNIFSTNFIEEGKLILSMTDHDPNKRPDVNQVFITFQLIWECRDSFRTGEYDGDLDEESFISSEIVKNKFYNKDRGVVDSTLSMYSWKMARFENFDERLDFEEEFLGKCSFGEVTLRKYKDGTKLAIKRMVLNKFDEKKIEKLLCDVVQIVKISFLHSEGDYPEADSSILFFKAAFDLKELILFTQADYCQDSLSNWMRNNQDRFDEKIKLVESSLPFFQFFIGVLLGIKVLKTLNIVHRDLKPSNIFLGFDNKWKISDSGLSRLRLLEYECEKDYYESLIAEGVPVYAAPEQLNHSSEDLMTSNQEQLSQYKIDIFSFGLILIEYLTPTFSHQSFLFKALENIRNQNLLPESLHQSIFETRFCEIILGMVRTNPQERLDGREVWKKYEAMAKGEILYDEILAKLWNEK